MNKTDALTLINAYESFLKLDSIIEQFTDGTGIGTDFRGLWDLVSIIKRNSKIDDLDAINTIIKTPDLSSEEKYVMLF